jgi:hypothetical protein
MPAYIMPCLLYNTVCAFNERLPPSARSVFQDTFFKRLELIPHPEQDSTDSMVEVEMVPTGSGVGHLDQIERWFFLGLLIDPDIGVYPRASSDAEAAFVMKVAILFRRWLGEDYPSTDEWAAIMDETKTPPPTEETNPYMCALTASDVGNDSPTMVSTTLDFAACSWAGARIARPPIVSASLIGRFFDSGLNWLARRLGRGESGGPGPVDHYLWQASWLMDLMSLRWLPSDPREETLFRAALRNEKKALDDYLDLLRRNKVESASIARTRQTIQRMNEWRRLASEKGGA